MTQGKTEQYHRSMKNLVQLQNLAILGSGSGDHQLCGVLQPPGPPRVAACPSYRPWNGVSPEDIYCGRAKKA